MVKIIDLIQLIFYKKTIINVKIDLVVLRILHNNILNVSQIPNKVNNEILMNKKTTINP